MKKKLIYYFYLTEDFLTNLSNKINFECLRRYAHIFDEASIFIATDSVTNTELIMEAERVFMSMPFSGNINFKVVNNTVYCESMVFDEEVVKKLDKLDCLLFFAHAKGYTNFKTYPENKEVSRNGLSARITCHLNILMKWRPSLGRSPRTGFPHTARSPFQAQRK